MISFLFYSHQEYSDLWGYLEHSGSLIPFKKYLAVNSNSNEPYPQNFEILKYDDSLSYSEKLISLLTQIQDPYVVLIHDNDLIVSFDSNIFVKYILIMNALNISRLMFGIIGKDAEEKIETKEFRLGSTEGVSCSCFTIPYDVSPSIWKREDFLKLLACVKGINYRDIEGPKTQYYCYQLGLKIWGHLAHPTEKSIYVIGRPFPWRFQFLHLLVMSCFVRNDQYMDQEELFKQILEKYPQLKMRKTILDADQIHPERRPY